ncbi:MAG TPA: class I SAM-dependent methyltransferase [Candidatus Limnocylindrales bacterium]
MVDSTGREADDCCTVDPTIARWFDRATRRQLDVGHLPPLNPTSARLADLLDDVATIRPTMLELGCGSGALTVRLLESGAASATAVDLSPASIGAARERAARAGVEDRAAFSVGDGATAPLEPHDWVVLDRVLCCYPDLDRLLAVSIGAARRRYALSVPVSWGWRGWLARLFVRLEAATAPLRGHPCRGYVHDVGRIEGRLRAAGLSRLRSSAKGMWYTAVFERAPG